MCRRSTAPGGTRSPPARPRHHHVERVQRLGWAVPLHRRDARLVRASVRQGVPGEAGAGRPHDADLTRPRSDGLPELGAAAGPVRLERGRGLVELGTAVPALGRVERLPGGRGDVARPRGPPGGPARSPAEPPASVTTSTGRGGCATARRLRRPAAGTRPSSAATRASGRSASRTTVARWSATSAGPTRTTGPRERRTRFLSAMWSVRASAGPRRPRSGSRSRAAATHGYGLGDAARSGGYTVPRPEHWVVRGHRARATATCSASAT